MRYVLLTIVVALGSLGCVTKKPPAVDEMRGEALPGVALTNGWVVAADANVIHDNWLASFGDRALEALVVEALTNNLDLRAAAARVEKSAGYVDLAKSALRPTLGLYGTGGFNMGGGDLTSALLGAVLGASWEIDLWGRARYGRNAAQAQFASAEADLEFARQSLAASVARSWFAATETKLQQDLAAEMAVLATEIARIADKRNAVGAGSEQDAVLAKASAGDFMDTLQRATLAHQNALRALEVLLGRYPSAELQARADLPSLLGSIPVGMPLGMLARRPDLIAAERRVEAAFYRIGEAKASVILPRISLNASGSYLDSDVLELKEDYDNPSGGAGGKVFMPIYDGGAARSQVTIRTAEQKEAVADYGRIALRAIADVENALAAARNLEEREGILRQNVADHERALSLAEVAYKVGTQDLRSVMQQQITVHNARLALLGVQGEQLAQRVNLHLALGGSFQEKPVEQAAAGNQEGSP